MAAAEAATRLDFIVESSFGGMCKVVEDDRTAIKPAKRATSQIE